MADVLARRPAIGFLEVHPENYVLDRSERGRLCTLRESHAVSLHSVGLSLGSACGINADHLSALAWLARELEPIFVSDHLAWNSADGIYLNDLLPLPYTEEALQIVSLNIAHVQDALGRRILVENPSRYADFVESTLDEDDFLRELARRTGCGLLLDVNNVIVSAFNLGFDADAYLDNFPVEAVEEIHLAGHARKTSGCQTILIDDHGSCVSDAVWQLFARARNSCPTAPALIEWDSNLPVLDVLLGEARTADAVHSSDGRDRLSLANLQSKMAQHLLKGDELPQHVLGLRGHASVYRNNLMSSLTTALELAFPVTLALVGDQFFRQAARAFIRSQPPREPYVAGYGAEFPDFLAAAPGTENIPYVADTAKLDWLTGRIALRDPVSALTAEHLAQATQHSKPDRLVFQLQESLAYFSSSFPVDKIWSYVRTGDEAIPGIQAERCFLELFHDGGSIRLRPLDEANFKFRQALNAGLPLAAADAAARDADVFFDLSRALRTTLRDGILVRCVPSNLEEDDS
jgi:uncharacterized protein (UPF0276 family)